MAQEKGIAYGWEERVSGDERLMIVTIAKLTQILIRELRTEIHGLPTDKHLQPTSTSLASNTSAVRRGAAEVKH